MSSNEANDYKILSIDTDVKVPKVEETNENNIIQFSNKNKVLDKHAKIDFSAMSYSFFKRVFDITASSIALLLLSPVFLATSIAIKKEDKNPAMFKQKRIGKNGKLFEIYKFRTMCPNADEKLKELLENDPEAAKEYKINKKLENDPRVTKIGSFLRRTSIDELPQLDHIYLEK